MSGGRFLQFLLREVDPHAAKSIAAAEPAEAVALIEALGPQEMPAAHYAASAFLELGPAAAPALKRWILAHESHAVLWATLENDVDPGPGLEAFGELLDEDDIDIVAAAAAAIGRCGAPGRKYATRLKTLAESGGDSWLRSQALRALGRVGAPETGTLEAAVREGNAEEHLAAVAALGRLGSAAASAVDAICECLEVQKPINTDAIAIALARIGERTPRVGDALAGALARADGTDDRGWLLYAIGRLHAPSAAAQAALDAAHQSGETAAKVAAYFATGDPAEVRAAICEVAWTLREWRVDPHPFADAILQALGQRAADGPPSGMDDLFGQLQAALSELKPEKMMIDELEIETMTPELDPSMEIAEDCADSLIGLAQRLGDPAAIRSLEKIAADERSPPWTREMANSAATALRGRTEA